MNTYKSIICIILATLLISIQAFAFDISENFDNNQMPDTVKQLPSSTTDIDFIDGAIKMAPTEGKWCGICVPLDRAYTVGEDVLVVCEFDYKIKTNKNSNGSMMDIHYIPASRGPDEIDVTRIYFGDGRVRAMSGATQFILKDNVYKFQESTTFVHFKKIVNMKTGKFSFYVDGNLMEDLSGIKEFNFTSGKKVIDRFVFDAINWVSLPNERHLDNLKVYTVEAFQAISAMNDNVNAPIKIIFENAIDQTTIADIQLLNNTTLLQTTNTIDPMDTDGKTVLLTPNETLNFKTQYTVSIPNTVKGNYGECMSAAQTLFVTTKAPQYDVSKLQFIGKISDDIIKAEALVDNNTTEIKKPVIAIIAYNSSGKIIGIKLTEVVVDTATEKNLINTSLTIPEGTSKIRAVVWNSIYNMSNMIKTIALQ